MPRPPTRSCSASFAPGTEQGTTDVHIVLASDKAVDGSVSLDNMGSISTGASRVSASVSVNNPAGLGDALQVQAVRTDGSRYGRVAYSVPVGNDGWRAQVRGSGLNYHLIGDLASTDGHGKANTSGAELSYPLLRSQTTNLNALLGFDIKLLQLVDGQIDAPTQGVFAHITDDVGELKCLA